MPTHNYGRFIADALRSLQAQTDDRFECIIVDNGSTDNTADIVSVFGDQRFKYLKIENNGVSAARNKGLQQATGEYLMFLDADDLLAPGKLASAIKHLENHPATDLVYSDMRYFSDGDQHTLYRNYHCVPDGAPWMPYVSGRGEAVVSELLNGNIMVVSSPIFRRRIYETLGGFDESLPANEDWDFWIRCAGSGAQFTYDSDADAQTLIRNHSSSLSRDFFLMQCCGLKVLVKNAAIFRTDSLGKRYQRRVSDHLKAIAGSLIQSGDEILSERLRLLDKLGLVAILRNATFGQVGLQKFRLRRILKRLP